MGGCEIWWFFAIAVVLSGRVDSAGFDIKRYGNFGGLLVKCAASVAIDMIDADSCRAFLVRQVHPVLGLCPHCFEPMNGRQTRSFVAGGRVRCSSCTRWFTWRTGTLFHRSPLDDRQLFFLLMLTSLHCSIKNIAIACRLSLDDTYSWQRRISEASHK